ncbi:hypothetical protein LDENG_00287960 [Lucifuga dentata]|nr:hypothetical protein LDENG_00287960 [Lucifuga dentata]
MGITFTLTGSNRWQHITLVLASLHWLPVHLRIDFKILIITFKASLGLAPSYICDMLIPYEPARSLRSSGSNLLTIASSNLKTKGDRAFAVRAPKLWNDLLEDLRLAKSAFKLQLKTHFYSLLLCDVIYLFCVFSILFKCLILSCVVLSVLLIVISCQSTL